MDTGNSEQQERKSIQINPGDFFHVETSPTLKASPLHKDAEKNGASRRWSISSTLKWWQDKAVDFLDNPNVTGYHRTQDTKEVTIQGEVKQESYEEEKLNHLNGERSVSEESESKNTEPLLSEGVNTMDFLFKQVLDFLSLMTQTNNEQLQTSILSEVQAQKISDPKVLTDVMIKMEEEKNHLVSEYRQNIEDLRVNIEGVRALVECREDSRLKLELELKKTRSELEKKTRVTAMFAEDYVILQGITSRLLSGESKESVLRNMTPHIRSFISCLDSTQNSTVNSTTSSTTSQTVAKTGKFTLRNKLNLTDDEMEELLSSEEDDEEDRLNLQVDENEYHYSFPEKHNKRQKTEDKQNGVVSSTGQSSNNHNNSTKKESNEVWASEVLFSLSKSDFPSSKNNNNNNINNNNINNNINNNNNNTDDTQTITRAQLELLLARDSLSRRIGNNNNNNNLQLNNDKDNGKSSSRGKKRRGKLPEAATDILKKWLFEHYFHPYPTEEEKGALATKTNLSLNQINNWFTNARRRILPKQKLFEQGSPTPSHLLLTNMPHNLVTQPHLIALNNITNNSINTNNTNNNINSLISNDTNNNNNNNNNNNSSNSNSNNSSPVRKEDQPSPTHNYNSTSPATSKIPIPQRHSNSSPTPSC